MKRKYTVYQVDSFTKEKFSGNPAGVVTNADGLTESQMQKIARELNNSETAFIFKGDNKNYDVHVRFFTPTKEVPICGHATIAAHYVRAIEGKLANNTTVYQKTGAGVLPVHILKETNDYKIVMTQGKITVSEQLAEKYQTKVLDALGIHSEDVREDCPITIASTGHSKVMIGIKENLLLQELKPHMQELQQLSTLINCNGYYVFTLNKEKDALVHGRMFAPAIGIPEDPVTGNANGPLGAYLVHYGLVETKKPYFHFNAVQGEAIGRRGTMEVHVKIRDCKPTEVQIAGEAVIIFSTTIEI